MSNFNHFPVLQFCTWKTFSSDSCPLNVSVVSCILHIFAPKKGLRFVVRKRLSPFKILLQHNHVGYFCIYLLCFSFTGESPSSEILSQGLGLSVKSDWRVVKSIYYITATSLVNNFLFGYLKLVCAYLVPRCFIY